MQHALVTDLFQLQLQLQFQLPTHSPHSPIHYLCLCLFLCLFLSLSLCEPLKPFICSLLLSKLQLLPSLSSCLICPNQLGFTIFYPLYPSLHLQCLWCYLQVGTAPGIAYVARNLLKLNSLSTHIYSFIGSVFMPFEH